VEETKSTMTPVSTAIQRMFIAFSKRPAGGGVAQLAYTGYNKPKH
jgi:hypothetical protein